MLIAQEYLTPKQIVQALDEHIIGQKTAKRKVAIALRNRWRRMQVPEHLRQEITPKNILMIGPTGVGKTEIARRLAKLVNAPFIKVEATKYTQIGYYGKDVDTIIRELVEIAYEDLRQQEVKIQEQKALEKAQERVLDAILPKPKKDLSTHIEDNPEFFTAREIYRERLLAGELDDREIEIDVAANLHAGVEIMGPPGMEDMTQQLQSIFKSMGTERVRTQRTTVAKALKQITDEEAQKLIDKDNLRLKAIEAVEQKGIVFIDEFDKITSSAERARDTDVSREGVQRDLLPLVEGCSVTTKYGTVHTDHVLFIASGAFHLTKPSDLIPELQGRFPIRVELTPLSIDDFQRILKEPNNSLVKQYQELLATENIDLCFDDAAIVRLAELAWQINESTENIGARRLHTVMETLLETISYEASERQGEKIVIDAAYVNDQLSALAGNTDLSQYVL